MDEPAGPKSQPSTAIARNALAKATGSSAANELLSRTTSDGTTVGDTGELVRHAKAGAEVGARPACAQRSARQGRSRRSADVAARKPLMPWTPPPGGADDEQRYSPFPA